MRAFLVLGLAFGDCGKGSMVDFLCRYHKADLVVRYNGGPQAGHNVVTDDGRHHTFAQFGSGSFIPGCRTYLSRYMLIDPYAMINEADLLAKKGIRDIFDRTFIDKRCMIITPWHWRANRLKELARGDARHGSCGMGIGEAREDQLSGLFFSVNDITNSYARDILTKIKIKKLRECHNLRSWSNATKSLYKSMFEEDPNAVLSFYKKDWLQRIRKANHEFLYIQNPKTVVFEGAQGILLDEKYGFGNYTSWTDCTFTNALESLIYGSRDRFKPLEITKIGVVRSYYTRHGAGPFVTESRYIPSGILPHSDRFNVYGPWQGEFRWGYFDGVALRYALKAIKGIDYLAVTHMDQVHGYAWVYCNSYLDDRGRKISDISKIKDPEVLDHCYAELSTAPNLNAGMANICSVPIGYESWGPTAQGKIVPSEEIEEKEHGDRSKGAGTIKCGHSIHHRS